MINLDDYPDLLTVEQFAEIVQVLPATVKRWIRDGLIKTWQLGREGKIEGKRGNIVRIPKEELRRGEG